MGKAARVPSALAIARLCSEGVGEKGRRAWPPRRSSKERIAARMWEKMDIVVALRGDCGWMRGEGNLGGQRKSEWNVHYCMMSFDELLLCT